MFQGNYLFRAFILGIHSLVFRLVVYPTNIAGFVCANIRGAATPAMDSPHSKPIPTPFFDTNQPLEVDNHVQPIGLHVWYILVYVWYIYLHENPMKSTIHVSEYAVRPMDPWIRVRLFHSAGRQSGQRDFVHCTAWSLLGRGDILQHNDEW